MFGWPGVGSQKQGQHGIHTTGNIDNININISINKRIASALRLRPIRRQLQRLAGCIPTDVSGTPRYLRRCLRI